MYMELSGTPPHMAWHWFDHHNRVARPLDRPVRLIGLVTFASLDARSHAEQPHMNRQNLLLQGVNIQHRACCGLVGSCQMLSPSL